ncbi:MAG: enoyl-CoA-hydratase DpgB [Trebonia sp.]
MVTAEPLMAYVDGSRPLTPDTVRTLAAACDTAEDRGEQGVAVVHVSGVLAGDWAGGLSTPLVSKWERTVRRLESLPVVTIAVADGECGGTALDALLATDYRIAGAGTRLLLPGTAGGTWPGMALFRLARQAAGTASARQAILFGQPISAGEALGIGLIDEVAEDVTTALGKAIELAVSAHGSELAIRRQLMTEALTVSYEDALGAHLAACDRALRRETASAA